MLTKLQAVNEMLKAIGETEVTSLASGVTDAEAAESTLNAVSKEVQEKGWQVNRELNFKLVPNADGRIPVPANTLRITLAGNDKLKPYRLRNLDGKWYLYNAKDQTFTFDRPVYVDLIFALDFEELTYPLQAYIVALAAKRFQQEVLGSDSISAMIKERLEETWAALQDAEAEDDNENILRSSPHARMVAWRLNPGFAR